MAHSEIFPGTSNLCLAPMQETQCSSGHPINVLITPTFIQHALTTSSLWMAEEINIVFIMDPTLPRVLRWVNLCVAEHLYPSISFLLDMSDVC